MCTFPFFWKPSAESTCPTTRPWPRASSLSSARPQQLRLRHYRNWPSVSLPVLTVEGEKDDICSIGQTLAAQDLCTGVRAYRRVHHMQAGVGHYGVFSGKRWNNEIYPLLRDFVHVNS